MPSRERWQREEGFELTCDSNAAQGLEGITDDQLSVEDYLQLDDNAIDAKYEYLNGVARLVSGASGEHDQIAFNVRTVMYGPGATVELTSVDVYLSMDEIYKRVNFDEPLIDE
jgi:hypothetical protein